MKPQKSNVFVYLIKIEKLFNAFNNNCNYQLFKSGNF